MICIANNSKLFVPDACDERTILNRPHHCYHYRSNFLNVLWVSITLERQELYNTLVPKGLKIQSRNMRGAHISTFLCDLNWKLRIARLDKKYCL